MTIDPSFSVYQDEEGYKGYAYRNNRYYFNDCAETNGISATSELITMMFTRRK